MSGSAISARDFIPHRSPIVFIDTLVEVEDGAAVSSFTVPKSSPYLDGEGRLMPEALLEIMAQCFAAGAGRKAAETGQPVIWGYLAAIRDMQVHADIFAGDILRAEAGCPMSIGSLHVVDCRVLRGEVCVASGQLKIFIPEGHEP